MQYTTIEFTAFQKTKVVRAECWNMLSSEKPDDVLFVERGEDMYALDNEMYRDRKVAIVHRNDWLKAREI